MIAENVITYKLEKELILYMEHVTGRKFANNLIWKLLEQYSAQGITLILSIILARLLDAADYGLLALTMIFINLSGILVRDGFITALVQKKQVNDIDYSTSTFLSFIISLVLYMIIFAISPTVSRYYGVEILTKVLRIISLIIFADAFGALLNAKAVREMKFRLLFLGHIISSIVSGIIGIFMAYAGYGVWALVAQKLIQQTVFDVVLAIALKWKFHFAYSSENAKMIISFGSKVMIGSMIAFISDSTYGAIIGKSYSTDDLGYFDKGDKLPQAILLNIASSVAGIMLPTLSSHQDDIDMVKKITRRVIRTSYYVAFPICFGLVVTAKSTITILFTEKWLFSVPIMQWFCLFYVTTPLLLILTPAFYAIGKTKLRMYMETVKMLITVSAVFLLVNFFKIDIYLLSALKGIISIIMILLVSVFTKKYLKYSLLEQIADIGMPFILSVIMAISVVFIPKFGLNMYITVTLQVIIGVGIYIILSILTKEKGYFDILNIIKQKLLISHNKGT